MCNTNVKTNFYYANICKHEHEKKWQGYDVKNLPKTSVEQTKGNEMSYFYLHAFGDLV
jgi:hypothetical protein